MTGLEGALLMFVVGGGFIAVLALLNKRELDRLQREIAEEEAKAKLQRP